MLMAAGLTFDVKYPDVDEAAIKARMMFESDAVEAADVAMELAARKALAIAKSHPECVVIGADQVLTLEGRLFSKANTVDEARETLRTLRGKTHELVSSVAIARNGEVVWQASDSAFLTMRDFSEEFLGLYSCRAGDVLTHCVGCYALEGLGVQLFERVEGDYFTVLGMPLYLVLEELRAMGLVMA